MSLSVFPKLVGQGWNNTKAPMFSTIIQQATSGKENRIPLWTYPRWNFEIKYNVLNQRQNYGTNNSFVPSVSALLATNSGNFISDDMKALAGFFMSVQGSGLPFYYDDPTDNWINGQQIGIGDGTTTDFQITRNIGGYTELIQNVNGTPVLANYWTASATATSGDYIIPSAVGIDTQGGRIVGWQTLGWPFYFICTTSGKTGTTEPNWRSAPVPGLTLTDGTAVWENIGVPFVVFVNGTAQDPSLYTLGTTGLLSFASAPIVGPITIVCGFYFQCRFSDDSTQFAEFLNGFWEGKSLKFISLK